MITTTQTLLSSEELLKDIRGRWANLISALDTLRSVNPRKFSNGELGKLTKDLAAKMKKAEGRLASPTLRIATLATGSAGKSTLVNALVGRRLVPMATGEMSAGHVLIRHAPCHKLTIENTTGALWKCGVFDSDPQTGGLLTDEGIYGYLKDRVMTAYHTAIKDGGNRSVAAPSVIIEAPILAGHSPNLFGLPPGIGIEILDLPGLNTLDNDDHNLEEIRQFTGSAFCVFVLDYELTLKDQKQELLKHARTLVGTAPNPDMVLFVINKALFKFEHDADDREHRLKQLKAEIDAHLGLENPVPIIALEALVWYLIQVAFGPHSAASITHAAPKERAALLQAFEEEFLIKSKRRGGKNLQAAWYSEWMPRFTDLPNEELGRFLQQFALPQSGGAEFLEEISRRLHESFTSLVIWPMVREPLGQCESYVAQVHTLIQTVRKAQQTSTKDAVEKLSQQIEQVRTEIRAHAGRFQECLDAINGAVSARSDDKRNREAWLEVDRLFKENGLKGSLRQKFETFARDLQADLYVEILTPLKSRGNARALASALPTDLANKLAHSWNQFDQRTSAYGTGDLISVRISVSDTIRIAELDFLCNLCQSTADLLREALHKRASYFLRQRAFGLESNLRDIVMQAGRQLEERINVEIGERDAVAAIFQGIETKDWHENVGFPLAAIDIDAEPDKNQITAGRTITEKKMHWKEVVQTSPKTINIFGWKKTIPAITVKVPWYGEVSRTVTERYIEYSFKSPAGLTNSASEAASDAVAIIAEVLTNGLKDSTEAYIRDLESSAGEIETLVEEQLSPLIEKIGEEGERIVSEWEALDEPLTAFNDSVKSCRSTVWEGKDGVA